MSSLLIIIVLLSGIYFLSYQINQLFLRLVFLTTKSQRLTTSLLSLLLYPGVVIHELSHLITAVLLFVPVKSMTLVPKILEGNKLQGGSVTIAKVDPVRRTLVGIAPLFVGIAVLWLVTRYLLPSIPILCSPESSLREEGSFDPLRTGSAISTNNGIASVVPLLRNDTFCNNEFKLTTIFALYLIFSVSSTMYSSKKDLEALLITIPLLLLTITIAYILGFQFQWIVEVLNQFDVFFKQIMGVLVIPLILQIVLIFLLKTFFLIFRTNHARI